MKLGGVIFACVGIIITVLVANGRWSSVWAAALNTPGTGTGTTSTSSGSTGGTGYTGPAANSGSFGTYT